MRHRGLLADRWRAALRAAKDHALIAAAAGLCLGYLACLAFLVPPTVDHWPGLAGLLWQTHPGRPEVAVARLAEPLNISILPHLFLRFHTDYGVSGLGALGFVAIACGTYALSRRHAWPSTAFTVTLVVASLPRVVLQAATPGQEIIPAAASLFCVLCVYRLIEQAKALDLALLAAGLTFVAFSGRMGLATAAVLGITAAVLLLRRHAAVFWWGMIRRSSRPMAAALPAVLLFSPAGPLLRDRIFSQISTPPASVGASFPLNRDGLSGALDNALRYLVQSVDLTLPVEQASRLAAGFSPARLLEGVYHAAAALIPGRTPGGCPFFLSWAPDELTSWFGPLSALLVLPAVLYAAWRGPRRLRAIAVGMIGYFYLTAFVAAWSPVNAGLFTVWYVCGGYLVAHLLPPWRIARRGRAGLQSFCVLLLAYALLFNASKPAFDRWPGAETPPVAWVGCPGGSGFAPPDRNEGSVWVAGRGGADRWVHARRLFGDERVEIVSGLLARGGRVGVVTRSAGRAYPFLAARPDVEFLRVDPGAFDTPERLSALQCDRFLFVDVTSPPVPPGLTNTTLWEADPAAARLPGALTRIGVGP